MFELLLLQKDLNQLLLTQYQRKVRIHKRSLLEFKTDKFIQEQLELEYLKWKLLLVQSSRRSLPQVRAK